MHLANVVGQEGLSHGRARRGSGDGLVLLELPAFVGADVDNAAGDDAISISHLLEIEHGGRLTEEEAGVNAE